LGIQVEAEKAASLGMRATSNAVLPGRVCLKTINSLIDRNPILDFSDFPSCKSLSTSKPSTRLEITQRLEFDYCLLVLLLHRILRLEGI
jgi:hypothetical protein